MEIDERRPDHHFGAGAHHEPAPHDAGIEAVDGRDAHDATAAHHEGGHGLFGALDDVTHHLTGGDHAGLEHVVQPDHDFGTHNDGLHGLHEGLHDSIHGGLGLGVGFGEEHHGGIADAVHDPHHDPNHDVADHHHEFGLGH
jgi:hypothetical protein